jgi:hypothetical protein
LSDQSSLVTVSPTTIPPNTRRRLRIGSRRAEWPVRPSNAWPAGKISSQIPPGLSGSAQTSPRCPGWYPPTIIILSPTGSRMASWCDLAGGPISRHEPSGAWLQPGVDRPPSRNRTEEVPSHNAMHPLVTTHLPVDRVRSLAQRLPVELDTASHSWHQTLAFVPTRACTRLNRLAVNMEMSG